MPNLLSKSVQVAARAALLCTALGAMHAQAAPIGPDAFGASSIVESFEAVSPSPNSPMIPGLGVLKPGVLGAFTFASGAVLLNPFVNDPPPSARGTAVLDFALGDAGFGLGENGYIASQQDVPDGSAFLALDAHPGPIQFLFPYDVTRVGALVAGNPGFATLSAFDVAGNLLSTATRDKASVSDWSSNFLGLEAAGIRRITFSDSAAFTGFNALVLDDLTFEPALTVAEPDSISLLAFGLFLLACRRVRKVPVERGAS
jgi:hypothetical protein